MSWVGSVFVTLFTHPSNFLLLYPGLGRRGSSLIRDAQTSFAPSHLFQLFWGGGADAKVFPRSHRNNLSVWATAEIAWAPHFYSLHLILNLAYQHTDTPSASVQTLLQSFRQSPAPLFPTCKQDHEITALLLRQKIIPSTECAIHPFPAESRGLGLGGANCYPYCWKTAPVQVCNHPSVKSKKHRHDPETTEPETFCPLAAPRNSARNRYGNKGSTATVQYPPGISLMSCQQCEPTMSIVQGLKSSWSTLQNIPRDVVECFLQVYKNWLVGQTPKYFYWKSKKRAGPLLHNQEVNCVIFPKS